MEVSVHIAPYIAGLGNSMPSAKLQQSHGFLQTQLIEKDIATRKYGAIKCNVENTLSSIICHSS